MQLLVIPSWRQAHVLLAIMLVQDNKQSPRSIFKQMHHAIIAIKSVHGCLQIDSIIVASAPARAPPVITVARQRAKPAIIFQPALLAIVATAPLAGRPQP